MTFSTFSTLRVEPVVSHHFRGLYRDAPRAPHSEMAARLQLVRTERAISRAELGRRTNLSPRAIAKIEAGGQSGIDVIEALAQALGISPAWLAFNEGPQSLPSRRRGRPPAQSAAQAD